MRKVPHIAIVIARSKRRLFLLLEGEAWSAFWNIEIAAV